MSADFSTRWAWAEVHTGIIQDNVALIAQRVAPAQVWAVVKANAYGHGSIPVAQAAIAGGATGLCVALVDEGVALRRAGIMVPILLLSEQPIELAELIVGYHLTPTISSTRAAAALAAAANAADRTIDVHIKVDTGMHRAGVQPRELVMLAKFVDSFEALNIQGVYTHFAVADDPAHGANATQLSLFEAAVAELAKVGINPPIVHAANSAATLSNAQTIFTMVRLGIAMYGLRPGPGVADLCEGLSPAMAVIARVSAVRWIEAGDAVSYGLRRPVESSTLIATVPLGYADGVPRALGATDVEVLLNGVRRRFAGTITMDQLMLDCGTDSAVQVGDEVVLIGRQGTDSVSADEWADAIGTIGYEIVCGISPRMFRKYL